MSPSREGFDISRIISRGSFGEGTVSNDDVGCELGLEQLQQLQLIGLSAVGLENMRGRCSGLILMTPNFNVGGLLFSFYLPHLLVLTPPQLARTGRGPR